MEGQFAGCAFAQLERLQGRRNAFRLSSALSTGDTGSVGGFVSQGWKVVDGAIVAGVMFLRGRARLHSIAVDETVTAVKEDVQWAQQQRS